MPRPSALETTGMSLDPRTILEEKRMLEQRDDKRNRLVKAMKKTKYRRRSSMYGQDNDQILAGWLTKMRKNHGSSALFATKRYFLLNGSKLQWYDAPNGRILGEAEVGGASIEHPTQSSFEISYRNGRKDKLRLDPNVLSGPTAKEWVLGLRAVALAAENTKKTGLSVSELGGLKRTSLFTPRPHTPSSENDDDNNESPVSSTQEKKSRRVFTVLKRIKAKGRGLERRAEVRHGALLLFDLEHRLKKKIALSELESVEQSRFIPHQLVLRWDVRHKTFRLEFRTLGDAETFFHLLKAEHWSTHMAPGQSYSSRWGHDSWTCKQKGWLRIRICTWNLGNRAPASDLGSWLRYPGADIADRELDDATLAEESGDEASNFMNDVSDEDESQDEQCDDDETTEDVENDDPAQDELDDNSPLNDNILSPTREQDEDTASRPRAVRMPPVRFEPDTGTADTMEDIVVVGCQECTYHMNNENASSSVWNKMVHHAQHHTASTNTIPGRLAKNDREDWVKLCSAQFVDRGYELKCEEHFWSLRLLIFVRLDHSRFVSTVETDRKGCGIGDRLGNKGAVAAALSLYDTTLCFVNAHLEANQNEVQKRNEDFEQIVDGLCLGRPELDILSQFDHVFWFGDLNYRVDIPQSHFFADPLAHQLLRPARSEENDVIENEAEIIQKRELLQSLRDVDQLDGERRAGRAFWGFQETPVFDFAPTYRFERPHTIRKPGERREYTPNRVPSWCDRVLWKSRPGTSRVIQTLLTSVDDVPELDSSDHAPLVAAFALRRGESHQPPPPASRSIDTPPRRASGRNEFVFLDILSACGAPGLKPFHFRRPQRCALRFFGRFIEPASTDFARSAQCLAPRWKAQDDVPAILVSSTATLRDLRHCSMQIQLLDQGEHFRVLGTALLELKECCDLQGRPWPFRVALSFRGVPCGELCGTLAARGPLFLAGRTTSFSTKNTPTPSSTLRTSSYLRKTSATDDHPVYSRGRSASWASAQGNESVNGQETTEKKIDLDLPVLVKPPPLRSLSDPLSPIPIPESPPRKPNLLLPSKFLHSNSSTPSQRNSTSTRWSPGFFFSAVHAEDNWSRPSGTSGAELDLEALFEPNHVQPPLVAVPSASCLYASHDDTPNAEPHTPKCTKSPSSPPRPKPPVDEDSVL